MEMRARESPSPPGFMRAGPGVFISVAPRPAHSRRSRKHLFNEMEPRDLSLEGFGGEVKVALPQEVARGRDLHLCVGTEKPVPTPGGVRLACGSRARWFWDSEEEQRFLTEPGRPRRLHPALQSSLSTAAQEEPPCWRSPCEPPHI